MADIRSETLALAALYQCCAQVRRIAHTGYLEPRAVSSMLRAVLVTEPRTIDDIYNPADLTCGFRQLVESMGSAATDKTAETVEITRMAFKLVSLEQAIERSRAVFNRMGDEVDAAKRKLLEFDPGFMTADASVILSPEAVGIFSEVYSTLISPNFPRLMIYGSEECLRKPGNQELIRALLLASIRAVVLWRQVGGRRRYLFFRRRDIVACAAAGALRS